MIIVVFWLLFFVNGLVDKIILRNSGIPGWAIVLVLFCVGLLLSARRKEVIRLPEYTLIVLFLACLPSFFSFFNAYSLSVLSIPFCFYLLAKLDRSWSSTLKERQFIVDVGLFVSLLSLLMFMYYFFLAPPTFGVDPTRPGFGYAIDRGTTLRLVGFADDPNFFTIAAILPLLIVLADSEIKRRKIALIFLVTAMFFSLSRTGLAALVVGLCGLFLLKRSKVVLWIPVFAAVGLMLLLSLDLVFEQLSLSQSASSRGLEEGLESRLNLINLLLRYESISLLGNGFGYSKELIGLHSHNTYFDFLFEGGAISFAVFLGFLLIVTLRNFPLTNVFQVYSLCIFVCIFGVSLPFYPLLYLLPLLALRYDHR